jgi:TatA/E family protein of Tat protein translocase
MHSPVAFIEGIGGPELMMIMFIILLLFGANRLPELARGLGKSVREFKKAASGVEEEVRRAMEEEPAKPAPKPIGTVHKIEDKSAPPATAD